MSKRNFMREVRRMRALYESAKVPVGTPAFKELIQGICALDAYIKRDRIDVQLMARYSREIRELFKTSEQPTFSQASKLVHEMIAEIAQTNRDTLSGNLTIVLGSGIEPQDLARFLAELSAIYGELSGGDELVIREGKVPAGAGVLV